MPAKATPTTTRRTTAPSGPIPGRTNAAVAADASQALHIARRAGRKRSLRSSAALMVDPATKPSWTPSVSQMPPPTATGLACPVAELHSPTIDAATTVALNHGDIPSTTAVTRTTSWRTTEPRAACCVTSRQALRGRRSRAMGSRHSLRVQHARLRYGRQSRALRRGHSSRRLRRSPDRARRVVVR